MMVLNFMPKIPLSPHTGVISLHSFWSPSGSAMAATFLVGLLLCLASGVSSSDEGVTRKVRIHANDVKHFGNSLNVAAYQSR